MSKMLYIASDILLPKMENPHFIPLTINEALERGYEVDEELLSPLIDPNARGGYVWSDIRYVPDDTLGYVMLDDFDDDFSILPFEPFESIFENIGIKKAYCASIHWMHCTSERCQKVIEYIKALLLSTDTVELWNYWDSNIEKPVGTEIRELSFDALTPEDIMQLDAANYRAGPPLTYCLIITK